MYSLCCLKCVTSFFIFKWWMYGSKKLLFFKSVMCGLKYWTLTDWWCCGYRYIGNYNRSRWIKCSKHSIRWKQRFVELWVIFVWVASWERPSTPFFGFLLADFHFDTEDGDKVLPGFLDSIIGIRCGETRSFPLVFPESWKQENLRGIHAQFTVSCCLLLC